MLLAGPGLGGLIVAIIGVESTTLYITAGTSFLAAMLSFGLDKRAGNIEPHTHDEQTTRNTTSVRRVLSDLRAGWAFLLTNRLVRGTTLPTAVFVAAIAVQQTTLMPACFTTVDLPGLAGLALSGISVGALIGAGIYAATVGKVSRREWFIIGMSGTLIGFIGLTNGPVSAALGVATIEAVPEDAWSSARSSERANSRCPGAGRSPIPERSRARGVWAPQASH